MTVISGRMFPREKPPLLPDIRDHCSLMSPREKPLRKAHKTCYATHGTRHISDDTHQTTHIRRHMSDDTLMSDDTRQTTHARRHTSDDTRQATHARRHTSGDTRQTTHVRRHMPDDTCQTAHVRRLTSDDTRQAIQQRSPCGRTPPVLRSPGKKAGTTRGQRPCRGGIRYFWQERAVGGGGGGKSAKTMLH